MTHRRNLSHGALALLVSAASLALGCSDDEPSGSPALDPLSASPAFSVVSTDYISTSIAMLDATGEPIDDDWYNSGTTAPSLVAPLSGDVALPTEQGEPGTFTVLDRLGTDVVTRFVIPDGTLIAQQRTQGTAMDTTFSSNPSDYVWVDASSAWVLRRGYNTNPSEAPENQGNDLLEMNPASGAFSGGRVDLSAHDADLGGDIVARAQPASAAWAGDRLVVGMDRAHYDYDLGTSWAPGGVAVVDLTTEDSVLFAPDPAVVNCSGVVPVPGDPSRVIVTCSGDFFTASTVGIFTVHVDGAGDASVEHAWLGDDDPATAVPSYDTIALDASHVLALEFGPWADPPNPDTLYLVDLESGEQTVALSEVGIGQGAYDPASGLVVVPTKARGLVRMQVEGDLTVTDLADDVVLAPALGLAPVSVSRL